MFDDYLVFLIWHNNFKINYALYLLIINDATRKYNVYIIIVQKCQDFKANRTPMTKRKK